MKDLTNLALTAGGMLSLLGGAKLSGLAMFAKGAWGLEQTWRNNHPEFTGDLSQRWEKSVAFYNQTHQNPTNRTLHRIGIPMIVGGAAGLALFPRFRPLWTLSAASFSAGWALNLIGHGLYEKNSPAFADDPLAFLAGPMWDVAQMRKKQGGLHIVSETVEVSQ